MKITYENTDAWIIPAQSTKRCTPKGFTQVFKIRPQGNNLMTDEAVAAAQEKGQAFVIFNLILYSLLG